MKEKIEKILKERRKTKVDLAAALNVTYQGLQHKLNSDTFKFKDIEIIEDFLELEKGYFSSSDKPKTPELWLELKEQYEKRIKDLEFIVYLYKQEKGAVNFLNLSKRPPVRFSGMRVTHKSYQNTRIHA